MVPGVVTASVVVEIGTVVSDDELPDPHADNIRTDAATIAVIVFFMVSLL
jgi:hypothetical protein